jgi:hypothetical protein
MPPVSVGRFCGPGRLSLDLFDDLGDPLVAGLLREIPPARKRRERDRLGLGVAERVVLLAAIPRGV